MQFFLWFQYINAAESRVYLVDPLHHSREQAESDHAANKFKYLCNFSY